MIFFLKQKEIDVVSQPEHKPNTSEKVWHCQVFRESNSTVPDGGVGDSLGLFVIQKI